MTKAAGESTVTPHVSRVYSAARPSIAHTHEEIIPTLAIAAHGGPLRLFLLNIAKIKTFVHNFRVCSGVFFVFFWGGEHYFYILRKTAVPGILTSRRRTHDWIGKSIERL